MKSWFEKNKLFIFLGILILIISIIILGCLFVSSIFYDQWIWKYYWGPIVADANPDATTAIHNGVVAAEGYTLISEITYGIILIISLYSIYKLFKKLKIIIDWRFCLALMPYILFGPVSRVLEDADFFSIPSIYWFISPLIYIQIATYALFFVLTGYYFENYSKKDISEKYKLIYPTILLIIVNVFITFLWVTGAKYGVDPIELIVFFLISCTALVPFFFNFYKYKVVTVNSILFSGGLLFLLPGLYLVGKWIAGYTWGGFQILPQFFL